MEVVGGSIPLATTNSPTRHAGLTLRPVPAETRTLRSLHTESRMFKFLGSAMGMILPLKFIF